MHHYAENSCANLYKDAKERETNLEKNNFKINK